MKIRSVTFQMLVSAALLAAGSISAQTSRVWTNSAGDRLLSTSVNWSPNGTPASGDTIQWNGTATGGLTLTNTTGLADSNPGLNVEVLAAQTSPLTIVENIGASGRIRFNTRFLVENGAGAVTFGSANSPTLPLALGSTGNGAVHSWTNNSANTFTINTNCFFLMGGGGSHTLSVSGSGNWLLDCSLQSQNSANLNLTVNGSGRVALTGNPTPGVSYSGTYSTTTLNGGTLQLGGANAIGTSTLTIAGGNLDSSVANLVNAGNNVQNWNGNFGFIGTQNLNIGSGAVTMGATRIVTVNANTLEVDGVISGAGGLTKAGAGTLFLNNANAYTGATTISNGTVMIGNSSGVPAAGNVTVYGTLDLNGNSPTLINLSGTGTLDTVSGGSPTLTLSNASSTTFSGVIKNTSGSVALTKIGNGTLTLGGTNTYSGATTISAGGLLLNGAVGAGAVTAATSTTFGGAGSVGGTVEWQAGSTALFTLTPTAVVTGSNSTPLNISGSVTLNGNSVTINVAGGSALVPGTYTVANYNNSGSSGLVASGFPTYTGAGVQAGTASTVTNFNGKVILTVALTGIDAVWTNGASGSWSAGANWSSNPNTPHLAGDGAILGVGSAYSAVTLDTPVSLGLVRFTNANSFQIADAGNTLTIDNKSVGAAIDMQAGASNAISPVLSLNDNLAISTVAGTALSLTNTINNTSAAKTLTISGAGTVALSGNNTYGPSAGSVGTILSGPVLQLNNNASLGAGDVSVTGSATIRAGAAYTVANNVVVGSGATATIDGNGNNVTLSGALSGAGGLTINGADTMTLNNSNSYAGNTTINAGTVVLGNASGIPGGTNYGNVTLGTNVLLNLDGNSAVLNALGSSATSATVDTLTGGAVNLTLGESGASGTFAGSIKNTAGPLTLVKDGTGTETLTGTNTYTGGTTINAGTLQIGNGGTTGNLGTGALVDNGNLQFNLAGTNVFTSQITGTGTVTLASSTLALWLGGINTFSGNINFFGGALWVTNSSALGIGPKIVQPSNPNSTVHLDGSHGDLSIDSSIGFNLSGTSGVLFNEAGSNTIAGPVGLVFGNGNPYVVVNNGFLTLSGTVSSINPRTLILGGAGNGLISGQISDVGGNVGSLTKQDAGTWTLSYPGNTYSGATTVSGGTLIISGANSGSGAINVNGGTLLFNGTDNGAGSIIVASNAIFGGVGSLVISPGTVTWQAGAKAIFTASASSSTPMNVYGNIFLNTNQLTVFVDGGTPLPPGVYPLLIQGNIISTISGSFGTTPIITGAGVQAGTKFFLSQSSTEISLVVVQNSVWVNNGNGNWTTGANWDSNPSYPSSAGQFATLGVGSSFTTVNLDSSETIGGLAFTNANSFTVTNAANTLTLNNNGNGAGITVLAGSSNSIATPLALSDTITVTASAGAGLSIPGSINGGSGLTFAGSGVVSLSGSNTYSGTTTLSGGTLILGNTNAVGTGTLTITGGDLDSSVPNLVNANNNLQNWSGSFVFLGTQSLDLGSGSLTVGSSGASVTVSSNTLAVDGIVSGSGVLTKAGNGTLVLKGANTSFSGGVTITGGALALGDDNALGTGTLNLSGGGVTIGSVDATPRIITNNVSPNTFDGPYIMGGTANLTFSGTIACGSFQKRFTITNTTTTFSGPFTGGTSQGQPNIKDGPGTLVLSADNSTLAKMLTVNQGTLALGSATAIGTGALTMNGGGLDSTVANLVNAGNNPQTWGGSFYFAGSQNLNMGTGAVTLNTNASVTVSNNTLTVGGAVSGAAYSLMKAGAGTLVLNGVNNYSNTIVSGGTLEIAQATLKTNSAVSITNGAVLRLDFVVTNQVAALVLNGTNQPAGVYGSTTPGGYLSGTGKLLVVPIGPSGPATLNSSVSGLTLSLSWPGGQGWRLQVQTNSLSTGLGTNWTYATDGSVSSTNITIDPTMPTVFYRLTYP